MNHIFAPAAAAATAAELRGGSVCFSASYLINSSVNQL